MEYSHVHLVGRRNIALFHRSVIIGEMDKTKNQKNSYSIYKQKQMKRLFILLLVITIFQLLHAQQKKHNGHHFQPLGSGGNRFEEEEN